ALLEPPAAARWTRLEAVLWRPRHLPLLSACTRLLSRRLEWDDQGPAGQGSPPPAPRRPRHTPPGPAPTPRGLAALPDPPGCPGLQSPLPSPVAVGRPPRRMPRAGTARRPTARLPTAVLVTSPQRGIAPFPGPALSHPPDEPAAQQRSRD